MSILALFINNENWDITFEQLRKVNELSGFCIETDLSVCMDNTNIYQPIYNDQYKILFSVISWKSTHQTNLIKWCFFGKKFNMKKNHTQHAHLITTGYDIRYERHRKYKGYFEK